MNKWIIKTVRFIACIIYGFGLYQVHGEQYMHALMCFVACCTTMMFVISMQLEEGARG